MRPEHGLQLEQTQRLIVTPQLRQGLTILQLPAIELASFLAEEIRANPLLEMDLPWEQASGHILCPAEKREAPPWTEHLDDKSDLGFAPAYRNRSDNTDNWAATGPQGFTPLEELMMQINASNHPANLKYTARLLVHYLDENGYLQMTDEQLAQELATPLGQVGRARSIVQHLEPRGLGARNLAECLCLQLDGLSNQAELYMLVAYHLDDLAAGRLGKIARRRGLSVQRVQSLLDQLRQLNPRPGQSLYSRETNRYLLPDVLIEKIGQGYDVYTNRGALPALSLNRHLVQLAKMTTEPEVKAYIQERIVGAQWLMKNIHQRQDTLKRVTSAILEAQQEFFTLGPRYLRPLTLHQVAEWIGMHESTVSRAVSGKYVQTPRGLMSLKFFFTSGVGELEGVGLAKEAVQMEIREIIARESPANPLSDQAIADMLRDKRNLVISRRTVAKYREELGILSSQQRKRYDIMQL